MHLWALAGISAATAAVASFADWKRQRRRELDRVGFMPWTLLTLFGALGTIIFAALALKIRADALPDAEP